MTEINLNLSELEQLLEPTTVEDFVVFSWMNPSNLLIGTPISNGGITSPMMSHQWGTVCDITFSSGRSETRICGTSVEIYPIHLSGLFSVIDTPEGRFYSRKPIFVPSGQVPQGYKIRSARSLIFVIANDPEYRPCAITFRSFVADMAQEAWRKYKNELKKIASSLGQKAKQFVPWAFAAVLAAHPHRVSYGSNTFLVSSPSLLPKIEEGRHVMIKNDAIAAVKAIAENTDMLKYPFCLDSTKTVDQLPWLMPTASNATASLPSPVEVDIVDF